MNKQDVISVYDAISSDYDRFFSEPSDHIDAFLNLLSSSSFILDAGCGPGVDAVHMASLGHQVVGVDLSEKMIFLAKQKAARIPFICEDITKLSFKSDFFDAILASYSLCYIPKADMKSCLTNFKRMLSPGGVLCLGLQEGTSGEIEIAEPFNPSLTLFLNVVSSDEITGLLKETGFEVVHHFLGTSEGPENLPFNKLCILARKM